MALEAIAQPQDLTTGLAILIVGLFGLTGYIGIRLYSPVSLFAWAIGMFTFIAAIMLDISFMYVWVIFAIIAAIEAISITVYVGGYGNV